MSTLTELIAKVTETDGKVDALIAAITAAKGNPATTLSPQDQTALDAAMADLSAEETAVEGATPPAPPATPAPPAPAPAPAGTVPAPTDGGTAPVV